MSWRRPVVTGKATVRWQNNREPRIADDRLATFGRAFEPVRLAAPELFTAHVMARLEVQPAPVPALVERRLREGLFVVVATLAFSLLIVLVSVGVLALFVPTTVLMLLGAVVSGLVSLFSVGGNLAVWMTSATASEVMIATLALMASLSLLIRVRSLHNVSHTAREA